MTQLELLLLGAVISVDAAVVTLMMGLDRRSSLSLQALAPFAFGAAHALFAGLGWLLGSSIGGWLQALDHWIAFGLLAVIGSQMIRRGMAAERPLQPAVSYARLPWIAIALSIDAFAVGLGLALLDLQIWPVLMSVGGIPVVVCGLVLLIARRTPIRPALASHAEWVAGLVLWAIGLRILADHLWHGY